MKKQYPQDLTMIPCVLCKEEMPKLRLTKFGYKSCVECSTTGAYTAVTTINGTGDHTWNDIQIMTPEQAKVVSDGKSKKAKWDNYDD